LRRIGWLPQVLVDPSRKNLETTAKLVGKRTVQTLAGDWTEAINAFDAAIVAAPHAYHGPLGTALAKAGKHVFMEKPLATSTAECRVIVEAAKQSGTILSVGLLRRYLHATRWTRELLQSGILGQIRHFEAYEGLVFNWAVSTGAMLSQQASGGGVLMDTGVHTLDLILWWLGEKGRKVLSRSISTKTRSSHALRMCAVSESDSLELTHSLCSGSPSCSRRNSPISAAAL